VHLSIEFNDWNMPISVDQAHRRKAAFATHDEPVHRKAANPSRREIVNSVRRSVVFTAIRGIVFTVKNILSTA
jgi:hypothetical protein